MNSLITTSLLLYGFSFTFFIPGFAFVETFFGKASSYLKWPLYGVLSVLISTYSVYLASHMLGFSALTIILVSLPFLLWFEWVLLFRKIRIFERKHVMALFVAVVIYCVFLIALYPAIFFREGDYIVMAANNWQDTAMHLSIIQSIAQGNFPPQAPYFSGHPLSYYYFNDLHAAILVSLKGGYFPRVLVYDNPTFALLFSLSLYGFTYYLTKSRFAAIFAQVLCVFYGNTMFIVFLQTIAKLPKESMWEGIISGIRDNGYAIDFNGLQQMPPVADYFMQNRPMMFGLPAVALALLFILKGVKTDKLKCLALAGFITGSLVKFQLFGFLVIGIFFAIVCMVYVKKRIKRLFKYTLSFGLPIAPFVVLGMLSSIKQKSLISLVLETFHWGQWETKTLTWNIEFIGANFNIAFVIFVVSLVFLAFGKKLKRETTALYLFGFILFAIPFICTFTIFNRDMFKFFYYMIIPVCIIVGFALSRLCKKNAYLGYTLTTIILVCSLATSALTLSWSILNKQTGYSVVELEAGNWIRNFTPQKSVFLTYPTVHSAVTDIAGRLRVISYINWPVSHGFNKGEDNAFSRSHAAEDFFTFSTDPIRVQETLDLYGVDYVYYGQEEQQHYPQAGEALRTHAFLSLVYDLDGIKIYQVLKVK